MIQLKKLYSIPAAFKSVIFESGLNFILGEKSDGNNKTNGVGKTMCVEFLNYCLLKRTADSRVCLIPDNVLDPATIICLDFSINNESITVQRAIKTPDQVTVFKNGKEVITNDTIEQASAYLGNVYFEKYPASNSRISFRNLLNPVIRDERSEFNDIIQCFDTARKIPCDYTPHLFFLNFDIDLYSEIKKIINELVKKTTYVTETKKMIEADYEKVSEAKAKLNELDSDVSKISASIEQLRANASFDSVQDDIVKLESQLSLLRSRQKAIKLEIKQIGNLPEPENISEKEIALLFNQFKTGLGDMVEKSLHEVKEFKNRIDTFRNTIINDKLEQLKNQLYDINAQIQKLDSNYSDKLSLLDNRGILKDLKTSIHIYNTKNQERENLRAALTRYEKADKEKKTLKGNKDLKIGEFDDLVTNNKDQILEYAIKNGHKIS